jgi:hypothetical protein
VHKSEMTMCEDIKDKMKIKTYHKRPDHFIDVFSGKLTFTEENARMILGMQYLQDHVDLLKAHTYYMYVCR